jgi:hypothetical protein
MVYSNAAGTLGGLTYSYDAVGHVAGKAGSLAATSLPDAVTSATYDGANELTQWGGMALSYDGNGNMLTEGASAYTWDARNRLGSAPGGGS